MDMVSAPPPAAEPESPEFAGGEESLDPRIGAGLIDLVLLLGLFVVLGTAFGKVSTRGLSFNVTVILPADWLLVAVYLALVLLYYFALEATIGRTVGKLLVGLRVVGRDGARPSVGAVGIRTVLRVVDWLPVLYLVGFVSMAATGARRQRLGDLAAGTRVPRTAPVRHRGLAVAAVVSAVVLMVGGSAVYVAVWRAGGTSPNYLDASQLEQFMSQRWHVDGAHLDSVRCPHRIEQRKGNDFQCRGRVADQDVTFQVHQDDNGHVHFENVEVFLHPAEVANRIAKELTERTGVPVEVDCGHGRATASSWREASGPPSPVRPRPARTRPRL